MLFEIHASGEGREFKLPLTTKGHLFIGVRVTQMDKPTYQELGLIHCEPVVKPLVQLKDLPATTKKMQREQSEAHITITLKNGKGLKAADRGGTSDPYVKFTLGEETKYSDVIPKTVNPVWDKAFELSGPLVDMQRATLHLEVFDDDLVSIHSPRTEHNASPHLLASSPPSLFTPLSLHSSRATTRSAWRASSWRT